MAIRLSEADVAEQLKDLPVLPRVVSRLMEFDSDSAEFFDEVLALTQQDPAFATRVLSVANSAAYSAGEPLTSLQQAVARIGTQRAAELVTSMGVMRVFVPSTEAQRNLWIHSLQTAVSAGAIAESGSLSTEARGQAYIGGLMHDLGRFVLLYVAKDNFEQVEETNWETPEQLLKAEKMICGFDHAALGAIASKHWGLPNFLVELVRHHHRYTIRGRGAPNSNIEDLVVTVQLADLFSLLMLRNPDFAVWETERLAERIEKECRHPNWSAVPVSPQALADKAHLIVAECQRLVSALGLAT